MSLGRINRRQFLQTAALAAAGAGLAPRTAPGQAPAVLSRRRPNLLFIHADQLHLRALSAQGCRDVHTPNLDRLVQRGVSFQESYSANPVCCPARTAWYTGRTPSEAGVVANEWPIVEDMPDLGQWFGARGYEAVYAGKWHVPGRPLQKSFKVLTPGMGQGEHGDAAVSRAAQGFLNDYRGDKPFFLSLGFLQPHDICYWVFAHTKPLEELPYPSLEAALPPLWANWGFDPREPEKFRSVWRNRGAGPRSQIANWPEFQWRYYRWSYYRHIEMVDAEIGRVLEALEDSGRAKDTLVVFTSDHGDGMGAHQLWQKMYFYEEAAAVPFVVSWPGHLPENTRDGRHLISGLDVAPTLCEFAGIETPPKCRGRSLRPLLEQKPAEWREFLVSEVAITGRMVRTPDYKFITYKGDPTEQLFDMRTDRGEMHNLAPDGGRADVAADLRKRLGEWESRLEPLSLEGRKPLLPPKRAAKRKKT